MNGGERWRRWWSLWKSPETEWEIKREKNTGTIHEPRVIDRWMADDSWAPVSNAAGKRGCLCEDSLFLGGTILILCTGSGSDVSMSPDRSCPASVGRYRDLRFSCFFCMYCVGWFFFSVHFLSYQSVSALVQPLGVSAEYLNSSLVQVSDPVYTCGHTGLWTDPNLGYVSIFFIELDCW